MAKPLDADEPCPAHDGFAMPAEWAPHVRTWMCWPCRIEAWGSAEALLRAKQASRASSGPSPLSSRSFLAARHEDAAEARLAAGGKAELFEVALDDCWARDSGPPSCGGRPADAAPCNGGSTPGATNIGLTPTTRRWPRASPRRRTCGFTRPRWSARAAPSTRTARARCSPPNSACSIPTAIRI